MKKNIPAVMVVAWLLNVGPAARADVIYTNQISWGVSTYVWNDHTNTPMRAGADAATGWLVQLIYAGTNGVIDPATPAGDGVSSDDAVVASGYFDSENWGPGQLVGATYYNTNANGSKFFFRAWEGVTSGGGQIPQPAPSIYGDQSGWWYGDSGVTLFTVTGNNSPPSTDTFEPTANLGGASGATAMQFLAIPEPEVAGLLLLGLGAMILRHRRQKRMSQAKHALPPAT